MAGSKSPLGLATLTGIVIASMIGAGVFTTSGFALGDLGSPWIALAAWFIGGAIALLGATQSPNEMLAAILTIVSGTALYFVYARRKQKD